MKTEYTASWYGLDAIVGGEFNPDGLEHADFECLSDAKIHALKNATKCDVAGVAYVVCDSHLHTNELINSTWKGWKKRAHDSSDEQATH